jgi:hypothetical protein
MNHVYEAESLLGGFDKLTIVKMIKNSSSFMKSERLLPCSLGAFKLPYHELDECTHILTLCKVHFNSILLHGHQSKTSGSNAGNYFGCIRHPEIAK